MAKAEKTLEEFISEYIANKVKSNSKDSYEAWLRSNGINAEKIYTDSIKEIEADYKTKLASYGSEAEAVAKLGLSGSGYSDYINGKAYSEMQREKSKARSIYSENSVKNERGYQNYINAYNKEQLEKFDDVVKTINRNDIIDYETAYKYAVSQGLSDDDAKAAAKIASDTAKKALKDYVMKIIVNNGLSETEAKEFAIGLGLSEEEAANLGAHAKEISNYYFTK